MRDSTTLKSMQLESSLVFLSKSCSQCDSVDLVKTHRVYLLLTDKKKSVQKYKLDQNFGRKFTIDSSLFNASMPCFANKKFTTNIVHQIDKVHSVPIKIHARRNKFVVH